MLANTGSVDPLEDQEILSEAKDILDRLILAVDILVSTVPVTDTDKSLTADILNQFNAALLAEDSDYFSGVHLTACQCDDRTDDRNVETDEFDVASNEESSLPFEIQMDENGNMDHSMAFEVVGEPLDEDLMGILQIPSSDDEEENFLMVAPLISGEDVDDELDEEDEIDFIERMMLYFRETDLMLEEQQQGGGDHSLEPPVE